MARKVAVFSPSSESAPGGISRAVLQYNLVLRELNWKVNHIELQMRDMLSLKSLLRSFNAIKNSDVIHVHGYWQLTNLLIFTFAYICGIKVIISPHGALAPNAFLWSKYKKLVFHNTVGRLYLMYAARVHACSMKEYNELLLYCQSAKLVLIPNIPPEPPDRSSLPQKNAKTLLFLGRVEESKGIGVLLKAWDLVRVGFPEWNLRIVGPMSDSALSRHLLAYSKVPENRVTVVGPLWGPEKWDELAGSLIHVAPSLTENFGFTVVEALSVGTPVIVSRNTPWDCLAEEGCGWICCFDHHDLRRVLEEAMSKPVDELMKMGERGSLYVKMRFSRVAIQAKLSHMFLSL